MRFPSLPISRCATELSAVLCCVRAPLLVGVLWPHCHGRPHVAGGAPRFSAPPTEVGSGHSGCVLSAPPPPARLYGRERVVCPNFLTPFHSLCLLLCAWTVGCPQTGLRPGWRCSALTTHPAPAVKAILQPVALPVRSNARCCAALCCLPPDDSVGRVAAPPVGLSCSYSHACACVHAQVCFAFLCVFRWSPSTC